MSNQEEIKELNRQITMGWKRGRDFGIAVGGFTALAMFSVGALIFHFV